MAPTVLAKKKRDFDPKQFLATIGQGRKVVPFPRAIYGTSSTAVNPKFQSN